MTPYYPPPFPEGTLAQRIAKHHQEGVALRDAVMGFTVPQNMAGLPTSIVSVGFDDDGLPVGLQLTAARWQEDRAVTIARGLELALSTERSAGDATGPIG